MSSQTDHVTIQEALINILTSHGYKLVTWEQFEQAEDRPAGLLERAVQFKGAYVVFDPHDDEDGWLLVGGDRHQLAKETCDSLELGA